MTITESYLITREFHSPNDFSIHIENSSIQNKCTLLEAIIDYCERSNIDVEAVAPLISKSLKEKIRVEQKLDGQKGILQL